MLPTGAFQAGPFPKQQGILFLLPSAATGALISLPTVPRSPQTQQLLIARGQKASHDEYITGTMTPFQSSEPLRSQNTVCSRTLSAERCSQQKAEAHTEDQPHLTAVYSSNLENLERCNNHFNLYNLYLVVFNNST